MEYNATPILVSYDILQNYTAVLHIPCPGPPVQYAVVLVCGRLVRHSAILCYLLEIKCMACVYMYASEAATSIKAYMIFMAYFYVLYHTHTHTQ